MNNLQDEYMAEYHRRRILEEVEQIRLEEIARKAHGHRPSLFERSMVSLANWMISTGRQLRGHYQTAPEETRVSPRTNVAS